MPAAIGTRLSLPSVPDDFHHHLRDGVKTAAIVTHAAAHFRYCLCMPNTVPPLTTVAAVEAYEQHVKKDIDTASCFTPVFVLYLTDHTTAAEIEAAHQSATPIVGVKYYPAGATTNSAAGVTDIRKCYPALKAMERLGMMLCIHSEVTEGDIFEREACFVETILRPLVADFGQLKITLEHISTAATVEYVMNEAPPTVRASITAHHLLYNRNHLLVGGIRPHLYCLPILKIETDRQALLAAVATGSDRFFLGTDSAPHVKWNKEAACGCAGVFTAHAAVELVAEALDSVDALDKLEGFCCRHGSQHYGSDLLPPVAGGNAAVKSVTLVKEEWQVPKSYPLGEDGQVVVPLRAGESVAWKLVVEKE